MTAAPGAERPTRGLRNALRAGGVIWLVLAMGIASGIVPVGVGNVLARFVIGLLLACDGGAFLLAGRWYVPDRRGPAMFASGLVALNLVLTLTGDLGIAGIVGIGLLGALLALLLYDIATARD
ncbi:MAG: hypothetical protein EG823_02295 [Actinobacteria bacterium]|nr:hypothetical protein [Actinomycetota bacterium]